MANISLGQYLPGDSIVHRLDPRTKILLMAVYIAIVFVVKVAAVVFLLPVVLLVGNLPVCARSSLLFPSPRSSP